MRVAKETKFGYGFTLAGIGLPFLIDKLLGTLPALIVAAVCTVVALACLLAGHFHKDDRVGFAPEERRTWWPIVVMAVLLISLSLTLAFTIRKFQTQKKPSVEGLQQATPTPVPAAKTAPQSVAPPQNQVNGSKPSASSSTNAQAPSVAAPQVSKKTKPQVDKRSLGRASVPLSDRLWW